MSSHEKKIRQEIVDDLNSASQELEAWAYGGATFDVAKVIRIIDEQNARIVQASGRS